jgi:hypothetical protein
LNKWLSIGISGVLLVALVATGFLYFGKSSDLKTANAEIATHKTTIEGLNADLAASKSETANFKGNLATSEATVVTLNGSITDLTGKNTKLTSDLSTSNGLLSAAQTELSSTKSSLSSAQSALSTAQSTNSTLAATVKKVTDPRHFSSLSELTDWLQKDDTNTKYASLYTGTSRNYLLMSYILEVRAARDGYILPAYVIPGTTSSWISNIAIVGDTMYLVEAGDDSVTAYYRLASAQPVHPEPLP